MIKEVITSVLKEMGVNAPGNTTSDRKAGTLTPNNEGARNKKKKGKKKGIAEVQPSRCLPTVKGTSGKPKSGMKAPKERSKEETEAGRPRDLEPTPANDNRGQPKT